MLVMARVIEKEQGDVERALDMNRQILEIDERNEQALDALERLYLGKGAVRGSARHLREEARPRRTMATSGSRSSRRSVSSTRTRSRTTRRRSPPTWRSSTRPATSRARSRSLDRIYLRNQQWKELADILGRQITIVGPEDNKAAARRAEVPARPAQGAAPRRRPGRDRRVPRHPRHRRRQPEGARRRSRSVCAAATSSSSTVAGILEPVYEQLQEWGPLVGVHEIQLAAEKDSLRRTSLLLRIGELQRTKLLDAEKAFDAYARAFREDPSTEAAKDQLEALAPLIEDGWARLVKLFEGALRDKKDLDPKLAHELATKVARSYEDRLGNSAKAVEFFKKALAIETDDLGALAALEAIFTRDEKYPELLEIYRKPHRDRERARRAPRLPVPHRRRSTRRC